MDWDEADLFTVPLLDGSFGLGQVCEVLEDGALVLLTDRRGTVGGPVGVSEITSLVRVPRDPLDTGQWKVETFVALPRPRSAIESRYAADGVQDPAVVEAFLSAWHGLLPWDYFPAGVFDGLLYRGRARPG
ncbi:hypothetical protein [Wenxinia marina]|uniref:Uncharacterized protein n=1 Tax=Wenxinia marina DSM 24838 TaxID=1123501 RepID=A0A0D0Q2M0_9RHOB|nr:hypothetical protein [Wenxinia marina]KIQ68774.1 hypothetical protein Wenmar_02501 [Wenxinia marina DSM 24838]GGL65280.1 hypothetical protein GCM10011392_19970 [Wenxinia marina]